MDMMAATRPRSYVCNFIAIHEFEFGLPSGNAQTGLRNGCMAFKNNRAILLCRQDLCIILKTSVKWNWSYILGMLNLGQIGDNCPLWAWNLVDDLKQWGTFAMLLEALCITSSPLSNSNLSYSPETLDWGNNWRIFVSYDLVIWRMSLKLQSGNSQFGSKLVI